MNGGVKVYTIACTDCIDNITNIAIIQLEKTNLANRIFGFVSKNFAFFDLPGLALTNHPCPFNFFFYVSFFGSLVLLYGMILFIVTEGYSWRSYTDGEEEEKWSGRWRRENRREEKWLISTTFYSYIHQVDGIIEVKETQMNLEVIAQLTVLTLTVVSGPLVIVLLAVRKGNL